MRLSILIPAIGFLLTSTLWERRQLPTFKAETTGEGSGGTMTFPEAPDCLPSPRGLLILSQGIPYSPHSTD